MEYPIWLIGDSSPAKWEADLDDPLDARHPARHNIWTPILEALQSRLFMSNRSRLDTNDLYIRNAVHRADEKPDGRAVEWSPRLEEETRELGQLLAAHSPRLVLSFGAFAFEFARRSCDEGPKRAIGYWSTERLGQQFSQRIGKFVTDEVNLVPLLHVSIARRFFLQSHRKFTRAKNGNYFEHVAKEIAGCLCRSEASFPLVGRSCAPRRSGDRGRGSRQP